MYKCYCIKSAPQIKIKDLQKLWKLFAQPQTSCHSDCQMVTKCEQHSNGGDISVRALETSSSLSILNWGVMHCCTVFCCIEKAHSIGLGSLIRHRLAVSHQCEARNKKTSSQIDYKSLIVSLRFCNCVVAGVSVSVHGSQCFFRPLCGWMAWSSIYIHGPLRTLPGVQEGCCWSAPHQFPLGKEDSSLL